MKYKKSEIIRGTKDYAPVRVIYDARFKKRVVRGLDYENIGGKPMKRKIFFYPGIIMIHLGVGLFASALSKSPLFYISVGIVGGAIINLLLGGYKQK